MCLNLANEILSLDDIKVIEKLLSEIYGLLHDVTKSWQKIVYLM